MSGEKVRVLVAMVAGFAMGCAIINALRGQALAVAPSSADMAVQSRPGLFSQSKMTHRASTKVSATISGISGLTPCAESKAFAKREKQALKELEKRIKKYEPGSAPAVALEATSARTKARFANYGKGGLLCGADGLPHLIAEPGLALKYGHANDVLIPTVGFLLFAGFIGESGRQYLAETKEAGKETLLDVPLALKCLGRSCMWPANVIAELKAGTLTASENDITRSPRL